MSDINYALEERLRIYLFCEFDSKNRELRTENPSQYYINQITYMRNELNRIKVGKREMPEELR